MKKLLIISWITLFSFNILSAQTHTCRTVVNQTQLDYMKATHSQRNAVNLQTFKNQITNVPLVAHVIRKTNGTGGLSTADLTTAMSDLNTAFAQLNFQFDLCETNYIDNDTHHDNNVVDGTEHVFTVPNLVANKVNVFFVPNSPWCGWAYYPSATEDWIIMTNSCATNGSTFPHELGHYFNLYHTHQGGNELVNGSNCGAGIGDELCDTPADPNLSGNVNSNCDYTGTGTDANGHAYAPDETNMMSYSLKECRTFFSTEQRNRMIQAYSFDRNYLDANCGGCSTDLTLSGTVSNTEDHNASNNITSTQTLTSSSNVDYKAGNLIRLMPGFIAHNGCDFRAYIGTCQNLQNTHEQTAFSEESTDNTTLSNEGTQETTFSNNGIDNTKQQVAELVNDYSLTATPNPFFSSTTLSFKLGQDTEIDLTVFDLNGRAISKLETGFVHQGTHEYVWQAKNAPPGIYLVRFVAGTEVKTVRVVLAR